MQFDQSYATKLADTVSPVKVAPLKNARLVTVNKPLGEAMELDPSLLQERVLLSQLADPESELNRFAVAQKYGGHQFGQWNPQLGDGRGLLLREVVTQSGERFDLHLKGAGTTPFSRFGDGRAVLRSTLREYLASEALHGLGIPTSRALCLIDSDEPVQRETVETGAMLIRVCQSHLRFGHFEYFYHSRQHDQLNDLFDYTLSTHYPHLLQHDSPHYALFEDMVLRTAELIAKWQAYGFCHGVMNTDNMSIHGITFDYGPYAFLDNYDPGYICNHSDHSGRYSFDNQPGIGLWNLNALAQGFLNHLSVEQIKQALEQYQPRLQQHYSDLMRQRLGISVPQDKDVQLLNRFLTLLEQDKRDFNGTFRLLADTSTTELHAALRDHFIQRDAATEWADLYIRRLTEQGEEDELRMAAMQAVNPRYLLRNYLAQNAIDAAQQGDYSVFRELLDALRTPFTRQPHRDHLSAPPPDWGHNMEISCSS